MRIRPTLIIGLGGSGTWVVRRLKRRIEGRLRSGDSAITPALQLLAFDTDRQKESPTLGSLDPAEFCLMDNFPGDVVVSRGNLDSFPAIQAFWKYRNLSPGFIENGAQQRPPVGRLAFMYRFDLFLNQVRTALNMMFRETRDYRPEPGINSVDVYVIGSCCGGTGAGMMFDCAALGYYLVREKGKMPVLQATVFLPSCFDVGDKFRSLNANACIFLRSLETIQDSGWPAVEYPHGIHVPPITRLFERVHLISGTNFDGTILSDRDSVYGKVALQLDLEISSAAAREWKSAVENTPAEWTARPSGKTRGYSSFGATQLGGWTEFTKQVLSPVLCEHVLKAMAQPAEMTDAEIRGIGVFEPYARARDLVLASENAVLELFPGYSTEMQKLEESDDPKAAILGISVKADQLAASADLDWAAQCDQLPDIIDKGWALRLMEGAGGMGRAILYLESVQSDLKSLDEKCREVMATGAGDPGPIIRKVQGIIRTKRQIRDVLTRDATRYLKRECILRVRIRLANALKPKITAALDLADRRLRALERARGYAEKVAAIARERADADVARLRASMESDAIVADGTQLTAEFERARESTLARFFDQARTIRLYATLADLIRKDEEAARWASALMPVAYSVLQGAGAGEAGPDWANKAAAAISGCQPLIQLSGNPEELKAYPKDAVARVFQHDKVRGRMAQVRPEMKLTYVPTDEPGLLEVTTSVLNFPLHAVLELNQIETNYQEWLRTDHEPTENRCALRQPALYRRIQETGLRPLDASKQALARLLGFSLAEEGASPRVVAYGRSYRVDGVPLDVNEDMDLYQIRRALNRHLLNDRIADCLIQHLKNMPNDRQREVLSGAVQKWDSEVRQGRQRRDAPDGWDDYLDMLEAERDAANEYLRSLP